MKFNALLDVNVVAHEADEEVAVLLELQAPAATPEAPRPQASLEVVLDRSGSMDGAPLEGAKRALIDLVRRLEPTDNFGLVTFDASARVVVPAGPLTDKEAVIHRIEQVVSGGMTDLSSGYLRGLQEIRRVASSGGTVLVISDGYVNAGIRGADEFAMIATKAYSDGIVTSTLGYSLGYDETLLSAIARAGSGNHMFADNPDAATAAIASEADGLLDKVVQAVTLTVACESSVSLLRLHNDLPAEEIAERTVMIELGDLYAEEARKVLLQLKVPALPGLGLAQIANLELKYVELADLVEHTITLPITVNVVPGDEAAGRVPHPVVVSELLFQEAQDSKRQASEAFEKGDLDEGTRLLGETQSRLAASMEVAPEKLKSDIRAELAEVVELGELSHRVGTSLASKRSRESFHRSSRKRGRSRRDNGTSQPDGD